MANPSPRLYGHIHGYFDVACPACQTINVVERPTKTSRQRQPRAAGYNPLSGVLVCRGCERSYYVGILLWAVGKRPGRPSDHVPQGEEVARLRAAYTGEKQASRGVVNRVCWCGGVESCPVHGGQAETEKEVVGDV